MGLTKSDVGTTTISILATLAVWEALLWIFPLPSFIVTSITRG